MNYKDSLKLVFNLLEKHPFLLSNYTFGGGTALTVYYNHRISNDIDIFLTDAQYLGYLSPVLNRDLEDLMQDYIEMAHFIKIKLPNSEIDFIIARNLTGLEPCILQIEDMKVRTDQPEEIVIKKMFYRAEEFKVRDVIDLAAVLRNRHESLLTLTKKICSKKIIDALIERMKYIKLSYAQLVKKLEIVDIDLARNAFDISNDFLMTLAKVKEKDMDRYEQ